MKILNCFRCKKLKNVKYFHKNKSSKTGYTYICAECRKETVRNHNKKLSVDFPQLYGERLERIKKTRKIYRENNKEKIKKHDKDYNSRHKKEIKEQRRLFRIKNSERLKRDNKKWSENNKEIKAEGDRLYRLKNHKKLKIKRKEYGKKYGKRDTLKSKIIGRKRATSMVYRATKNGRLAKLREVFILCVDCNKKRAVHWEHRDYNKPLDVEPVCVACNQRRGPAISIKSTEEDT